VRKSQRHRSAIASGLLALALIFGRGPLLLGQASRSSDASCRRDYPIPTQSVDYEKALASETLAPDRINVNGKVVRVGATEMYLIGALGTSSTVVEDWMQRTAPQQCEYVLDLLRNHPNSMHLYKLKKLQLDMMSGLFRVSEWELSGIGRLRAFFHKSPATNAEASYLYYLTLIPTAPGNVERSRGPGYVLTRKGAPIVKWDVRTNVVSIVHPGEGQ
jgi:hypothetical protein